MRDEILLKAFLEAWGQQPLANSQVQYALADVIAEQGSPVQEPVATRERKASQSGSSDSALTTVLKSGFGVAPLIGGLISLFGGGGDDSPAALVKYAMPPKVQFDAEESGGAIAPTNYDQMGTARNITVNVSAMDARSFLDRSGDIAAAVRDAMLNLNSINDVVNDL